MMHRMQSVVIVVVVALLCIFPLAACASSSNQSGKTMSSMPKLPPTPTPTPQPKLVYQSDWSKGLQEWKADPKWKLMDDGDIQIETTELTTLTLPYQPTMANYSVEVRFKIEKVLHNGGSIHITASKQKSKDGYKAGVMGLLPFGTKVPNGLHPQIQTFIDPASSMDRSNAEISDYEPADIWHTFRVNVIDSRIVFYIDDIYGSSTHSTVTKNLSSGPIQFQFRGVLLRVDSVKVKAM